MANRATTAVPSISADAVPAVRRGLRIELRRASLPGLTAGDRDRGPDHRGRQPCHDGTDHHDPDERSAANRGRSGSSPSRASLGRGHDERDAAGGDQRAEHGAHDRGAGAIDLDVAERGQRRHPAGLDRRVRLATRVTTTRPPARRSRSCRSSASAAVGMPKPSAVEQRVEAVGESATGDQCRCRRRRCRRPATRSTTAVSTWRREAPSARSSADSRVRWATTIESVLWIVNVATSSATPANTSRNASKKSRKSAAMSASSSAVSVAPVTASRPAGSGGCDGGDELLGRHAGAARQVDGGDWSSLPSSSRWAVSVSNHGVRHAAEALAAAELGDADDGHVDRVGHADGRRVADVEVAVIGGVAVDHDLTGACRGRGRRSARTGCGSKSSQFVAERRRAVAADRLAVGADSCADAFDDRQRRSRRRDCRPARRRRLRRPSTLVDMSAAPISSSLRTSASVPELPSASSEWMPPFIAVAEHERGGEEGDADDDGDRCRRAGGACAPTARRRRACPCQFPSCLMRSSRRAGVGVDACGRRSGRRRGRSPRRRGRRRPRRGSPSRSSGRSSRTARLMKSRISPPVRLSRLPVGSSAKITLRLARQRAGDGDALLLAARQLARAMLAGDRPSPTVSITVSHPRRVGLVPGEVERQQ